MPNPLPIDKRLETAAQLVLRTRIFYDIWRFFEGKETRPAIIDTMRCYSEFFRFDPHAHFVAFVVHVAALFEKRNDTVNLPRLAKESKESGLIYAQDAMELDALFRQATPLASKAAILRNNLFAHRSATLSYADAFKKAAVTPNELRDLTEIALKTVNRLLSVRGLNDHVFNTLPLTHADGMLKVLARYAAEESE